MKLFFASPDRQSVEFLIKETPVRNILFSYAYIKDCSFLHKFSGLNLLVDSGAFTSWTKNKQVDIDEYVSFIKKEVLPLRTKNRVDIINLDVIPAKFGQRPTEEDRVESAEKGLENYYYMRKKGIETIHTYHMFEDKKYLDIIKKECKYIGISPANDCSLKQRIEWLKWVFSDLRADYKTHILGLTSPKMLEQVPVYSCDSIGWRSGPMFGNAIGVKDKKLEKFITERGEKERAYSHNIKELLQREHYYTKLWEKRGIKWD